MLKPTPLAEQADGLHPVLVQRTGPQADPGYMIALMPLADPVVERLGVRETYRDQSVEFRRYRLRSSRGRTIRTYAVGDVLDRYGDYRGLDRGSLLRVLTSKGGAVSQESTLTAIGQRPDAARVTLCERSMEVTAEFDLVVAADGLHSDSGVSSAELPQALASCEAAQRPRVEAAQDNSRQLARVMFRRSRMVARIRDLVARFVTLDVALGPIRQLLEHRPLTGVAGHSGR